MHGDILKAYACRFCWTTVEALPSHGRKPILAKIHAEAAGALIPTTSGAAAARPESMCAAETRLRCAAREAALNGPVYTVIAPGEVVRRVYIIPEFACLEHNPPPSFGASTHSNGTARLQITASSMAHDTSCFSIDLMTCNNVSSVGGCALPTWHVGARLGPIATRKCRKTLARTPRPPAQLRRLLGVAGGCGLLQLPASCNLVTGPQPVVTPLNCPTPRLQ